MRVIKTMLFTAVTLATVPQAYAEINSGANSNKQVEVQLFKQHDTNLQRNFTGSSLQFSLLMPQVELDVGVAQAHADGQLADLEYEEADFAFRYNIFSKARLQLFAEGRFSYTDYSGALTDSYSQYGAGFFGRDYWGEKLRVEVRLGYQTASSAAPDKQKGLYSEAALIYPLNNNFDVLVQWTDIGNRSSTGVGVRYSF